MLTAKQRQQQPTKLQAWESRSTLTESVTGLGTRLSRILSSSGSAASLASTLALAGDMFKRQDSSVDAKSDVRSHSRGRDAFQSSGRGGAGNIRRTSTSRDPATTPKLDGPDDFSQTRGREMGVTPAVTHTGRGGAGNIRSPSRGRAPAVPLSPTQHEKEVIKQYAQREADLPHSSGRGGAGNIAGGVAYASSPTQSQSRSRSGVRSSGRGGAGNMISPTTTDIQGVAMLDELERIKHHHPEGLHSTGRGGLANFTTAPSPGIDLPPIHESHGDSIVVSSGRGGAGNIRQTSRSRTRGD